MSLNTTKSKTFQKPLKGLTGSMENLKEGWKFSVEGMGDERVRVIAVKSQPHQK